MAKPHAGMAFRFKAALLRLERLKELVQDEPKTKHEIAAKLHLSWKQVSNYVNYLHRDLGQLYIQKWVFDPDCGRGRFIAYYRLGSKKDAAKPVLSNSERCKRWVERRKAAGTYELFLKKRAVRHRKPKVDDFTQAFFEKELKSKLVPT